VSATGVLCARVRVEEKQIIAALAEAGEVAMPVPPASAPLPPGPAPQHLVALGGFHDATTGEAICQDLTSIIDRCQNRAAAAATLQIFRAQGLRTLDAGIAATGNRLLIASALAVAGVPRPACLAAFSERSGMIAADHLAFPSTLLSLTPGGSTVQLHDRDTADAVIEHRVVLGRDSEAIFLLQAGAPAEHERAIVHVVDGRAIATEGADVGSEGLSLAETCAHVLQASIVEITIATAVAGLIVWDVQPVGDFRGARLVGERTVADAIAALVGSESPSDAARGSSEDAETGRQDRKAVVRNGLAITA